MDANIEARLDRLQKTLVNFHRDALLEIIDGQEQASPALSSDDGAFITAKWPGPDSNPIPGNKLRLRRQSNTRHHDISDLLEIMNQALSVRNNLVL